MLKVFEDVQQRKYIRTTVTQTDNEKRISEPLKIAGECSPNVDLFSLFLAYFMRVERLYFSV